MVHREFRQRAVADLTRATGDLLHCGQIARHVDAEPTHHPRDWSMSLHQALQHYLSALAPLGLPTPGPVAALGSKPTGDDLNAAAAAALDHLASLDDDHDAVSFRSQLVASVSLMWLKELASLERTLLGRTFSTDRFDRSAMVSAIALVVGQQSLLSAFDRHSTTSVSALMRSMLLHPSNVALERYEQEAFSNGVGTFGVDAHDWFTAADDRLGLLRTVEAKQLSELDAAATIEADSRTADHSASSTLAAAAGFVRFVGRQVGATCAGLVSLRDLLGAESSPDEVIATHTSAGSTSSLRHIAVTDPLTGLPNRSTATDLIAASLQRSRLSGSSIAVLNLDIDNFKVVNDSLGHDAGDQLIQAIARRLQRAIRTHDIIVRLGGDEFLVIAEAIAGRSAALDIGRRLLDELQTPFELDDGSISINASIGVAFARQDHSPADLLRDSDTAAFRAKDLGRGRVEFFDEPLRAGIVQRHEVEQNLHAAIEAGQIEPWFQPIVDVRSGRTIAVEALARWRTDDGVKGAGEFIPAAEAAGLLPAIGDVMMRAGFRRRPRSQLSQPAVTVNFAADHLARPGLPSDIDDLLHDVGARPGELWVEVTEQVAVSHPTARSNLLDLRQLGCVIALDDFGTGFSALSMLKDLPIDVVKLDGSFVHDLASNTQTEVIVESVLRIARTLGLRVIAEGVEELDQLDALVRLGCDMVQGFGLERPAASPKLDGLMDFADIER